MKYLSIDLETTGLDLLLWAESKGYLKIPSDQIINEYKQEKNG